MIENKDQLIDIYDIWYEPFWTQIWFKGFIIVCISALVAWLCYFLYIKYIKKPIVIDCAQIAYQDLDNLKNCKITTPQDSKNCYFKLSSIIKHYLACRYHIIFTQLTDKEIMRNVEPYVSDADARLLQRLLQSMEFIKFEYELVAVEKLEKDIQSIREFIYNTTLDQAKEV